MEKQITAFTKEWSDLRLHKVREIVSRVNAVLEKKGESYITVHIEGLRDVPVMFMYRSEGNMILIYAGAPEDYNGTEEDKTRKIAEVIANAEIVYEGITKEQIIDLQDAINKYREAEERINYIRDQMRDLYKK